MFSSIGTLEIVIIAAVIILLFGAKRLPIFAKGLGESKKAFQEGLGEDDSAKKSSKTKVEKK